MKHTYSLEYSGISIELLRSFHFIQREEEFLEPLLRFENQKRLQLLEAEVTILFNKFDTLNHRSNDWRDNLKTLLAHGFKLMRHNKPLIKSYSPLTFSLKPAHVSSSIHCGYFYRAIGDSLGDQFIKFCKVTEYPPGIHQYVISKILFNAGGMLCVHAGQVPNTLVKLDPITGVISGNDDIIHFLLSTSK